ncbi:MAG: hypothetical protein WBJ13_12185 [Sedimentibacter sp.]
MVNLLNLKPNINKQRILKKLHIVEETEANKIAISIFDEVCEIIKEIMNLTVIYAETESLNLGFDELDNCKKHVICFISSKNDISEISSRMMNSGKYMQGYLIHEVAEDVIFSASNHVNKIIRSEAELSGYKLTKRYAAGDGTINLNKQQNILDALKKEIDVDVYLNEYDVLIPGMSLLYVFGLYKNDNTERLKTSNNEECSECSLCENLNCLYREE